MARVSVHSGRLWDIVSGPLLYASRRTYLFKAEVCGHGDRNLISSRISQDDPLHKYSEKTPCEQHVRGKVFKVTSSRMVSLLDSFKSQ